MKIQEILDDFVKECGKKLNLLSIIQFGSSTYSKNFDDIDLMFVFNDEVVPAKEILKIRKLIQIFEKNNSDVVFDFGGFGTRKRVAKYSITVVLYAKGYFKVRHHPAELFLLKNLQLDKHIKILYGSNPLENLEIQITNKHLFEMLYISLINALRKNLEDEISEESMYFLFKSFLRAMLINDGHYKKEELLEKFENKFVDKIQLPKNSKAILSNKLEEEDFEAILKFAENCLRHLSENKNP